jgi:hypothetical protein
MEDYYGLAGIFKSTQTFYGNWIDSENNNHGHLIRLPEHPGQTIVGKPIAKARVQQLKTDLAKLNAEDRAQNEYIAKAQAEGRDLSGEFNKLLGNALRIIWTRGGVEGALERRCAWACRMGTSRTRRVMNGARSPIQEPSCCVVFRD